MQVHRDEAKRPPSFFVLGHRALQHCRLALSARRGVEERGRGERGQGKLSPPGMLNRTPVLVDKSGAHQSRSCTTWLYIWEEQKRA